MAKTAKVFMTGRSQAVRLPKEFRFEGSEVEIARDPVSGGVLLKAKTKPGKDWTEFFKAVDELRKEGGVPDGFLHREDQGPASDRGVFDDWKE